MSGGLGSPPVRPPAPPPPKDGEFVLKDVPGRPGIKQDQHGRWHNMRCSICNASGELCFACGHDIPGELWS